MRPDVDFRTFLSEPEAVTRAFFEDGGPLALAMSATETRYEVNPVQVEYAVALARTAARGRSERRGSVTPLEGSTGVGKSVAILSVSMLTACLTHKPALITTYTRFLNRQIVGPDGTVSAAAVEIALGRRPRLALYRPRSAFASPSICKATSERMRVEAAGSAEPDRSRLASGAASVAALGEWSSGALERFACDPSACTADLDGLIETFLERHPDLKAGLDLVLHEDYALASTCPSREQVPFLAYAEGRAGADVLVATHAALILDRAVGGGMLDPDRVGYSLAVIDEANRVEDAGRLSLGVRRSVAGLSREASTLLAAMAEDGTPQATRNAVASVVDRWIPHADELLETLRGTAATADGSAGIAVTGTEKWIGLLREVHAESKAAASLLERTGSEAVAGALHTMRKRGRDVRSFLDVVERAAAAKAGGGRAEGPVKREDYYLARLRFSPTRRDPAISIEPKAGSRVIGLLWSGRESVADAVVVTSATLATPGMVGNRRFASILSSLNLHDGSPLVNFDLGGSHEMKRFGRIHEVVLADPDAPLPSDGEGGIDPMWVTYVARGVRDALADAWRSDGRNRVVVLANSFADADAIGAELADLGEDLIVRGRGDALSAGFDTLEMRRSGVLVTTGAWDGVNRPGLMDHLVIPRVPFAPNAAVFTWGENGQGSSKALEEVSKILRQGIGRPIRSMSDETKVWILDPRIGLPEAVQSREARLPHPRAYPILLAAFPDRFAGAVDAARILEAGDLARMDEPVRRKKAGRR